MGGHQQAAPIGYQPLRRCPSRRRRTSRPTSPTAAAAAAAAAASTATNTLLASRLEASIDAHASHLYPAGVIAPACLSAPPTHCHVLQISCINILTVS